MNRIPLLSWLVSPKNFNFPISQAESPQPWVYIFIISTVVNVSKSIINSAPVPDGKQ